jgi:cyclophilin family peptidyl-prolyl cis-trans isomerase/HEAT repeat protein
MARSFRHSLMVYTARVTAYCLLFTAFCLQVSCAWQELSFHERERNRIFAEILKREDQRSLADDFLKNQLEGSPYPEVRQWCAIALGRIGDPRALPWLYPAFRSTYRDVRAAAAFAVGEIEDREMLKEQSRKPDGRTVPELAGLLDDPAVQVRMRAVEAIGKAGPPAYAVEIAGRMQKFSYDGSPHEQTYLALAITALMRLQNPAAVPLLERFATETDPEIQWRAANALFRMRARGARATFLRLLDSPNPDVRAHAARGLGICEDPDLARRLHPLLAPFELLTGNRLPLSVRVCAVQALGNLKNPESVRPIEAALLGAPVTQANPDQVNFAVQAAAALASIGSPAAEPVLVSLLKVRGPVADSAVVALARLLRESSDRDRFYEIVQPGRFSTPAEMRSWAQALGELKGPRAIEHLKQILIGAADQDAASPYALAVPSVLEAMARAEAPDLSQILPAYLSSRDGVVLRAAVAAYKPRPGTGRNWEPLIQAYGLMAPGTDVEAKIAVLNALEPWMREPEVEAACRLALKDRQRNVRLAAARLLAQSGATDIPQAGPSETLKTTASYEIIAGSRRDRMVAVLETTRGRIEIELYPNEAPITVDNFASLAKGSFYNGLSFMRVVPYFVIQGGDPRNDMEGGPGYTIRCEINMLPYERGSVGMALSGKDTGGSQFFIALSPQPHLEGGYTCFGRVISGMPAVERMIAGDRIIKAWIENDAPVLDVGHF